MADDLVASARPPRQALVISLSAMNFLLWVGGSAILPLLPSYLRHGGSSPGTIGIVMSAYYATSVLTQYPAGRLADATSRRAVLLVGLVVFAIASVGFSFTTGALLAFLFRGLQGIGAGAATVAAASTIGARVPANVRGRAFGAFYGSQMLAFATGPIIGSSIGASSIRLLFVAGGAIALLATVPVLFFWPPQANIDLVETVALDHVAGAHDADIARRALIGAVIAFGCMGLLAGVYEACWTLLLKTRGATTFEIGISWTMFALPFALLSLPAGRLAERVDRRKLGIGALWVSAGFAVYYPFVHVLALLIVLGFVEAVGSVVGSPASVLILSASIPPERQGAAQGSIETARTASTAMAAAWSGALFGIDPAIPFAVGSTIVFVATVAMIRQWRPIPARLAEQRELAGLAPIVHVPGSGL